MCCCARLHRHQIHLISYGIVSCSLITTGLVFTVFAIFQKESQIGKVWLAGPTTMVVGLVLAGKVVIDWGPAMQHAREGSIDSRLFDQMNTPSTQFVEPMRHQQMRIEHEPKCNGSAANNYVHYNNNTVLHSPMGYQPPTMHQHIHSPASENAMPRMAVNTRLPRSSIGCMPPRTPEQCLIYSQYNSPLNKMHYHEEKSYSDPRHLNNIKCSSPRRSPRPSLYNAYSNYSNPSNHSGHSGHSCHSGNSGDQSIALSDTCECTQYGSIRRNSPIVPPPPIPSDHAPYQGESFVLNERSYLI